MTLTVRTDNRAENIDSLVSPLVRDRIASRLFAEDPTLWGAEAEDEARDRLGWVNFAERAAALIPEIEALRQELNSAGIDRIVLSGMGGSSLAPQIIARWAGARLTVLDSTHPERVRSAIHGDLQRTAVVISSKSGSTVETLSHKAAFEHAFAEAGLDPSKHMMVVTDPGTDLATEAARAGWRVFTADPRVGGRYSALTAFGLVPAGLAGADIRSLVADAQQARASLAVDGPENPAVRLAAGLALGLPKQYVLGVRSSEDADWGLGLWVEQLLAESTGKNGQGVLPIDLERDAPEGGRPPANMTNVVIGGQEREARDVPGQVAVSGRLGAQLLLWEAATAILGRVIGVNPFDQPDVEAAKAAARRVLSSPASEETGHRQLTDVPSCEVVSTDATVSTVGDIVSWLRNTVTGDRYLSVQAYLDEEAELARALTGLRQCLANTLRAPVSLDWGPRFLHSTGQFHKGGPQRGVFLQLLDTTPTDVSIPGSENGFGSLIAAQAQGDRDVLASRGLPVLALRCVNPRELVDAMIANVD